MGNYEQYKFYFDIAVSFFMPIVSALAGITLKKLTEMMKMITENNKMQSEKVDELERKIDEGNTLMRKEFNDRIMEERQLMYRLIDSKGVKNGN